MRLALLGGQQAEQFIRVLLDRRGDALDDLLALLVRGFLPALERTTGSGNGAIELVLARGRHTADDLFVRGVQDLQPFAIVDHLAVDQVLVVGHPLSPRRYAGFVCTTQCRDSLLDATGLAI